MDRVLEWAWGLFDRWDVGPSVPMTVGWPEALMFGPGSVLELTTVPGHTDRVVVSWREGPVLYVRPARRR